MCKGGVTLNREDLEILMDIKATLSSVETKLEDIPQIRQDIKEHSARLERVAEKSDKAYSMGMNAREDIGELKSNYQWLSRTVAGAILTSIIGIVVKFMY